MNILKNDRKKEKNTVSFMHVQNIICSQTQVDGIVHGQTIICRQLFVGHGLSANEKKEEFASNDNNNYSCHLDKNNFLLGK